MRLVVMTAALALLAGCADSSGVVGGAPSLSVVPSGNLPPPDRSDLSATSNAYLVGPFDKLAIDVFGIEDLSDKEVQVDASGRISFPLAGVVEVAGLTPGEIETVLTQRLREAYVRNPQVTVNLKETVSQVVTIEGEVREPGLYPVIGRMTLLRAIARAKGTTEFSKLNNIMIFRTVNGQKLAALYNLGAIRKGNYSDPEIYANDVIVVSDSKARRVFKDLLSTAPLLTAPLVAVLNN